MRLEVASHDGERACVARGSSFTFVLSSYVPCGSLMTRNAQRVNDRCELEASRSRFAKFVIDYAKALILHSVRGTLLHKSHA